MNLKNTGCNNNSCFESEVRRGPWTIEEDNLLIQYVSFNGEGHWNSLAKYSGLKRTGKSCRLRWLNYLKPDIKRGNLSPHEQILILELHAKWGNRWSKIAKHLPGRTDNEIKNYWRTRVQKQARQLQLDSNSHKFLETVRMLWWPRMLEKMEQDLPFTSSPLSSITAMETQKFGSLPQLPDRQAILSGYHLPGCPNSNNLVNNPGSNNSSGEMINIHQPTDGYAGNLTTEKLQFESSVEEGCDYYEAIIPNHNDIQELGSQDMSRFHVAGGDWFGEGTFWDSMDDGLWQLEMFEKVSVLSDLERPLF